MNAKRIFKPEPAGLSGYKVEENGLTIVVFYDRSIRLWTAYPDPETSGELFDLPAEYGMSREEVVDAVIGQVDYRKARAARFAALVPPRSVA